jgi:hypothetical protein
VNHWFGDWQGNAYHEDAVEIIPFGSLKAEL